MKASEQLRRYRTRHVIMRLTIDSTPVMQCAVDEIAIVRRGKSQSWLYRHDPDEIKRLVKAAAAEQSSTSRPEWENELLVIYEQERWSFRVFSEVSDLIQRALAAQRGT